MYGLTCCLVPFFPIRLGQSKVVVDMSHSQRLHPEHAAICATTTLRVRHLYCCSVYKQEMTAVASISTSNRVCFMFAYRVTSGLY